jgi:hypothetical protein
MPANRMSRRLYAAAVCLALAASACISSGQTPSPIPPTDAATLTPTPTIKIVSPTAVPVFATPTASLATSAPELTPTITSAPAAHAACAPPNVDPSAMGSLKWVAYCDTRYGFGFRYPTVGDDSYAGNGRVYLPYLLGTNLHEKYIDVTVLEGAATCESPNAGGYTPGSIPAESIRFNGTTFIKQTGSDAGAGNYHEWVDYSTMKGSLCVSMSFVLHWVNAMNYDTPPPEFDEAAESAVFPTIMSTFYWFTP